MAAAVAQSNEIVKRRPNVGGAFVADSISIEVEADAISRAAKTSRAASAAALGSQRSTRPGIATLLVFSTPETGLGSPVHSTHQHAPTTMS